MRRKILVSLAVTGIVASAGIAVAPAATEVPTLTRIQVVLTKTGDWTGIEIENTGILAANVAAKSPSAVVTYSRRTIVLKGAGTASATVDAVLRVPERADPYLVFRKSMAGESSVRIIRNNTARVVITELRNTRRTKTPTMYQGISRSTLVGEGLTIPMLDPRRLTLAFYYPWFNSDEFDRSGWYDRPTGPFRTDDAGSVATMTDQARGAGINGFVVSWSDNVRHVEGFDLALATAQSRPGFLIAPLIELAALREDSGAYDLNRVEASIRAALARAGSPSFLRVAGRPVLFMYGSAQMSVGDYQTVMSRIRASGEQPFIIGYTTDPDYTFDGSYYYNPNGYDYDALRRRYDEASNFLRMRAQVDPLTPQRLWAATVSPGMYKKSGVGDPGMVQERGDGGSRYNMTWSLATRTKPEWILITSWNEWMEATHIQPSERFGTRALDQTRGWAAYFSGRRSDPPTSSSSGSSSGGGLLARVTLRSAPWQVPTRVPVYFLEP